MWSEVDVHVLPSGAIRLTVIDEAGKKFVLMILRRAREEDFEIVSVERHGPDPDEPKWG